MGNKLTNVLLTVAAVAALGIGIYFAAEQPSSGDLLNQWANTFTNTGNQSSSNSVAPPLDQTTCSTDDYTTKLVPWSDSVVSIGLNEVVGLDSISYTKLIRALWWEHCNANSWLKEIGVIEFGPSGEITGSRRDLAVSYDLARNIRECTDDLAVHPWATLPPYAPGYSPYLPYVPVYSGLDGVPGNYHVSTYIALDTLQGLDCLEALALPAKCTIYGINCEDRYPSGISLTADVEPLGSLPNLKMLGLSGYYLPSLEPVAQLTNLQVLLLDRVSIKDDKLNLAPLVKLDQLKFIDVSNTRADDLSPLADLHELRIIKANNIQATEGIFGGLYWLKDLTKLQDLELAGTPVAVIGVLSNLKDLARLNLSATRVNDVSPLKDLPKLQELDLSNIKFFMIETEAVKKIPLFKQFKALKKLNLLNTDMNPSLCEFLKKEIPQVEVKC